MAAGQPVKKYRQGALDRVWLWNGGQLLAEFDQNNQRIADYQYTGTDQPYAYIYGSYAESGVRYHEQDALGNVLGTHDGTTVTQTISYDPWGVPSYSGQMDSRLMWKGLLWEGDAVGLYYMRGRWYDPQPGRFIQEDPIHSGVNDYVFAGDDPVNGSDPSGADASEDLSRVYIWGEEGTDWPFSFETLLQHLGVGGPGPVSPGSSSGTRQQPKPKPKKVTCKLVAPAGNYDVGTNAAALFQQAMADALTKAFTYLNSQGITPQINSGYRSPADQIRMRSGGSGLNPAAVVSWHQAGMAVDINGTASSNFPAIVSAMQAQGLTWGGTFTHRDLPHFQLPRAGTSPSAALVTACGGG